MIMKFKIAFFRKKHKKLNYLFANAFFLKKHSFATAHLLSKLQLLKAGLDG